MRTLLLIFLVFPALLCAQSHERYTFAIPAETPLPFVAESSLPAVGKTVSLSAGGNIDRSTLRASWGAVISTTSELSLDIVFPRGVAPIPPGDLVLTSPDGSTDRLAPTVSSIPNSALALLADQQTPLDVSADQDQDGLSLLLEHMLHLSDQQRSQIMSAFTIIQEPGGMKLTAPLQLLEGYDLLIRPALNTAKQFPSVMLASENKSPDGTRLEISGLPKTFIFKLSVISPAE